MGVITPSANTKKKTYYTISSGKLVRKARENEEGNYEIKPATHSDKKLLIKIFQDLKNYK